MPDSALWSLDAAALNGEQHGLQSAFAGVHRRLILSHNWLTLFVHTLAAARPILLHAFGNFLALFAAHRLSAPSLAPGGRQGKRAGRSLEFFQGRYDPFQLLFLGV